MLIVCEGKKTEPIYFQGLVNRYRLSTANVVVAGIGSDPRRLVATAKKLEKKERLSAAAATGTSDPSTEVHLLVAYLQALKP